MEKSKNNISTKIAVAMATKVEAKSLLLNDTLKFCEKKPFRIYECEKYILIITGIGKYNAAMSMMYLASKYYIEEIINLGAAGAASNDFKIGECLAVKSILDYSSGEKYILSENNELNGICCATVDNPIYSDIIRNEIKKSADIIDMESAGLVIAAKKLNIKLTVVKYISDISGMIEKDEIIKNIKILSEKMYDQLHEYLTLNIENKLDENSG